MLIIVATACSPQPTPFPTPAATSKPIRTALVQTLLEPRPLLHIDPDSLDLPKVATDSDPIEIGVFLAVGPQTVTTKWSEREASAAVVELVASANTLFAECGMRFNVEVAQVVTVPEDLIR